jgi:hypothetical protein
MTAANSRNDQHTTDVSASFRKTRCERVVLWRTREDHALPRAKRKTPSRSGTLAIPGGGLAPINQFALLLFRNRSG